MRSEDSGMPSWANLVHLVVGKGGRSQDSTHARMAPQRPDKRKRVATNSGMHGWAHIPFERGSAPATAGVGYEVCSCETRFLLLLLLLNDVMYNQFYPVATPPQDQQFQLMTTASASEPWAPDQRNKRTCRHCCEPLCVRPHHTGLVSSIARFSNKKR